MNYRAEIDGLRAVAVAPVILFHAGFDSFSGGFVGVDIFFVISGYLITSILIDEMRSKTFSLIGFYERRARRILPALYTVMLICVPIASTLMLPDDFENFGQSVVATAVFSNNVLLWLTSGYFELASEFKPLLHTWSLGVEEQFYVVFPLLLLCTFRIGKRWSIGILVALSLISLVAAQWASANEPRASFLLLPTRAWELLMGALIAFRRLEAPAPTHAAKVPRLHQVASIVGFILIAYSILAFDKNTPFPSAHALLPTGGAALIILFARSQTLVGKILSTKLFVGIGLISYSAYLWHQPVLAFQRIGSLHEPDVPRTLLSVAATFLLAFATWYLIEKPFRNRALFSKRSIAAFAVGVGALTAAIGWQVHAHSGFADRFDELSAAEIQGAGRSLNAAYNERPYQYERVEFIDPNKTHVLVIGNSFARDFINSALENGYLSTSEIAYSSTLRSCIGHGGTVDVRLRTLLPQAHYVIFGSPPREWTCWHRDLEILTALGAKNIIVIGTKNFGWNLNAVMRLPAPEKYSYRAQVLSDVWQENEDAIRNVPNASFVNLLALLADANHRVPVFTDEGQLISQDTHHLTKAGAKFVGKILFEHPLLAELK